MAARIDVLDFLEIYRQFPCLWDKSNPEYKLRHKRDLAEDSILRRIKGIEGVKALRSKMRSIRGAYNNEVRKIKSSMTTGSGEIYKPKLHWFDFADAFLSINQECDDTETNLIINSASQIYDIKDIVGAESSSSAQTLPGQSSPSATDGDDTSGTMAQVREKVPTRQQKRKKTDRGLEEALLTLKEVRKEVNENADNEFFIFGRQVGVQLNKMSLPTALITQKKIQDLLTDARLADLTCSYQPSSSKLTPMGGTSTPLSEDSVIVQPEADIRTGAFFPNFKAE